MRHKSGKIFRLLFGATLLCMATIMIIDTHLKNEVAGGIIDFELAGNYEKSQAILQSWSPVDKIYAGFSLGIDYLFLLLYTSLFVWITLKVSVNQKLVYIFAGLFVLAGLFDAVENYLLFKILTAHQNHYFAYYANLFAATKFALIFIGILYLLAGYIYRFLSVKSE